MPQVVSRHSLRKLTEEKDKNNRTINEVVEESKVEDKNLSVSVQSSEENEVNQK